MAFTVLAAWSSDSWLHQVYNITQITFEIVMTHQSFETVGTLGGFALFYSQRLENFLLLIFIEVGFIKTWYFVWNSCGQFDGLLFLLIFFGFCISFAFSSKKILIFQQILESELAHEPKVINFQDTALVEL